MTSERADEVNLRTWIVGRRERLLEFSVLILALAAVNIVLGVGLVTILCLLFKFGARTPTTAKDPNYLPQVSIVIPTCNEEMIIEERLENIIDMDYPHELLEVIFVDDSKDRTRDIIKRFGARYPYIKLLKQERPGFNSALNQGYSAATGSIVVKSDCDAFPLPDALREIVANFADNRVGAVSGVYHFDSSDKLRMERLFRNIQTRFKQTEAYLHSALISHGGFGAYRKHLIPQLPEEITADDCELVINVIKGGYRAIIDPSVKIRNPSPEDFSERRKQLDRRAAGVIRVILKNTRMLLNPRFGKFGLITMPMEFFTLVAVPILALLNMILVLLLAMYQPAVAAVVLALTCFFIISTRFSVFSRMLLDTYISCFHGIFSSFTEKKTWEKEKSRKELLETAVKS